MILNFFFVIFIKCTFFRFKYLCPYNFRFCFLQELGTDALRRLQCTLNLEVLREADFIVEAIVESEDIKKNLFVQLDKIAKRSCILASNTSSISITRLASSTSRPQQVFFQDSNCVTKAFVL